MILRFQVTGFKNLRNVDLRLGPLTCIAGFNGVGKSNFFDALLFLRHLADGSLLEAAELVRGGESLRNLFTSGSNERLITLSADLLIPRSGPDEFNQKAVADSTMVNYRLGLRLEEGRAQDRLVLVHECLEPYTSGVAARSLLFPHSKIWRESVLHADRRVPYISTNAEKGQVKLHQDRPRRNGTKKGGGRTWEFPLGDLPRTVLSSARNAQESPTAVLVRSALRRLRILQLEPTALRQPDDFSSDTHLAHDGRHLPATLLRLQEQLVGTDTESLISNRLSELLRDVRSVRVDRDAGLRRLTLYLRDFRGVELPAVSLSDGTLRFLALAVLELDPEETGVICLEEPENGVHPERMESMLRLLTDIAVDPQLASDETNPLRQVLFSTHSSVVAELSPAADLVFARASEKGLSFEAVGGTWRTERAGMKAAQPGDALRYIRPVSRHRPKDSVGSKLQLELPFAWES